MNFLKKIGAVALAILMSFWIFVQNAFAVSAAFSAGAAPEVMTVIISLLVGAGIITQAQADSMGANEILTEFELAVSNPLAYATMQDLTSDSASVRNAINDLAMNFVGASATDKLLSFSAWVKKHRDNVSTTTVEGSDFDMKGFGACLDYVNGYEVYYGDVGYITRVVGDTYYISLYGRHAEYYQNGEFVKWTDSFFSLTKNKNSLVLYGDWRFGTRDDYINSVPATDIAIPVGSETVTDPIGTVTIDGVEYPVNADGTVTVGDNTYPLNPDGSVTIPQTIINENGDTITVNNKYYPTYNFEVYDDSAILDLLKEISENLNNKYIVDEDVTVDPSELDDTVSMSDIANGVSTAINYIPFSGMNSVFAVLESATLTTRPPEDIVLNLDTVFYEGSITLIPASILTDWRDSIAIIKILISLFLIYIFIIWFRRKIFAVIGGSY